MRRLTTVLSLAALAACADDPFRRTLGPETPSASLTQSGTDGTIAGQYIVVLNDSADPAEVAAEHGIQARHQYRHLLTGFAAPISDAALESLRLDPRVRGIEADAVVEAERDLQTQTIGTGGNWGLDRIDQRAGGSALDGLYSYTRTGGNVRVYIVDTGIRTDHVEFLGGDGLSRASVGFDAVGDGQNGVDCNGHGTHVAGTVGSTTYGVAKDAKLVAVRVLNCAGSGSTSNIIAGLEWIAEHGRLPAVASMSLGFSVPQRSNAMDRAVQSMFDAGILLVMSAGNGTVVGAGGVNVTRVTYDSCLRSPSATRVGITVGNATRTDARSSSSNWGDCVDVFAPGTSIRSTWWTSPTATATASGTSMATPHVSGVAALFLQQARGATAQQVKDGILSQATKGVVTSAQSVNNHMVYSLVEAPKEIRGSNPKHEFPCTPKRKRDGRC